MTSPSGRAGRKPKPKPKPKPNPALASRAKSATVAPFEFYDLNRQFYAMSPHLYIRNRLTSLTLMIAEGDATDDLLASGVEFQGWKIQGDDERTTAEEKEQYATIESVTLLHHSCEAMLRLYLAHEYRNPCPWLALSSELSFAEFKRKLSALRASLVDQIRIDDMLEVFTGTKDPTRLSVPQADWDDHSLAIVQIFRFALDQVLDDANIYNASKHGLALRSAPLDISLSSGDIPFALAGGPSLTFLERTGKPGAQVWQTTTAWISPTKLMAVTLLVSQMIEYMCAVAKAHRGQGAGYPIHLMRSAAVDAALAAGRGDGVQIKRISQQLHSSP